MNIETRIGKLEDAARERDGEACDGCADVLAAVDQVYGGTSAPLRHARAACERMRGDVVKIYGGGEA
jgi:hypothetical protein